MNEIMTKQGHEEETGKAKITSGYNLPAKYILHTVGPVIRWKVTKKDEDLLASCYRECLKLAADTGVESIALCCLSTGVFRFPQKRAAGIATDIVKQFLKKDSRIKKVIFAPIDYTPSLNTQAPLARSFLPRTPPNPAVRVRNRSTGYDYLSSSRTAITRHQPALPPLTGMGRA